MEFKIKSGWTGKRKVSFNCPSCKSDLLSPLDEAGQEFPCPMCGRAFVTPGAELLKEEAEAARMIQQAATAKVEAARAKQVAEQVKRDQELRARQEAEQVKQEADKAKRGEELRAKQELERIMKMTPLQRKTASFAVRAARAQKLKNMTREQRGEYVKKRAEVRAITKEFFAVSKQRLEIMAEATKRRDGAKTLAEHAEIGRQLCERLAEPHMDMGALSSSRIAAEDDLIRLVDKDWRHPPLHPSPVAAIGTQEKLAEGKERPAQLVERNYGPLNPAMICPHCQKQGSVRTKQVDRKMGISGGKATGAILTGGISLLATGLSRNEKTTQAHCDNCNNSWDF